VLQGIGLKHRKSHYRQLWMMKFDERKKRNFNVYWKCRCTIWVAELSGHDIVWHPVDLRVLVQALPLQARRQDLAPAAIRMWEQEGVTVGTLYQSTKVVICLHVRLHHHSNMSRLKTILPLHNHRLNSSPSNNIRLKHQHRIIPLITLIQTRPGCQQITFPLYLLPPP